MQVSVGWNFNVIRITNTGTTDVVGQQMTVYIKTPGLTYKAEVAVPRLGEAALIPLSDLVKSGTRFDPRTQAVSEAWVGGAGYDYNKYGK